MKRTVAILSDQSENPDGSITIRPRRVADDREISAQKAAEMLGFRDRESIYRLIEAGEIRAWRPASKRGNGKYRINLESVMSYRERRAGAW